MSEIYIPRTLYRDDDTTITETELLPRSSVLIVLAEPGAGKTRLLENLARSLDTVPLRASIFRNRKNARSNSALVVDAIDEVARIDQLATEDIIAKAHEHANGPVVFASRAGEWNTSFTRYVHDCFGTEPTVVRLQPFDEGEQRRLFEGWFPDEAFDAFLNEARRFEVAPLLGNPQFLQLLGEAYIESGRHYSSKAQIFTDAVRRLAHEKPTASGQRDRPPSDDIIAVAEQIFAKILLSGAVGVSQVEQLGDRDYPYLKSLYRDNDAAMGFVLHTRLFKPSSDPDQHEPVHRLVAEYCAARYIVGRVADPGDHLSLKRVLAIIAPNRVVRDELRGMLGWMAALGNREVQEAAIELDAYAVLSNGDPSQLLSSVKSKLLVRLRVLAAEDPDFRRSDRWRTFNVGTFFDAATLEELRSLLQPPATDELQALILELLRSSKAAAELQPEIAALMLDKDANYRVRRLALSALLDIPTFAGIEELRALIAENTSTSLRVAATLVSKRDFSVVDAETAVALFRQFALLYPSAPRVREREVGSRHFIKQLIQALSLPKIEHLLNALTDDLHCTCGNEKDYNCTCRVGVSKIVGGLLDQYFELHSGPCDPATIWRWTKNLNFSYGSNDASRFKSVEFLQQNANVRQAIHLLALEGISGAEAVQNALAPFYYGTRHAGLRLRPQDMYVLADHAFVSGNMDLWASMWVQHLRDSEIRAEVPLRTLMRRHSNADDRFLAIWAKRQRWAKQREQEENKSWRHRHRRYALREARIKEGNLQYAQSNRDLIESGRHWGYLKDFANYYLLEPEKMSEVIDDPRTAETALKNCFSFLSDDVPPIEMLSSGEGWGIAHVLHAACLAHFREHGSLEAIDRKVLTAVKTDAGGYPAYQEGEQESFEAEIDRLIFAQATEAEAFLRAYVEPQLSLSTDRHANVDWLESQAAFRDFRERLPLEWLRNFPAMPIQAMRSLFGMAAQYGDRQELLTLIQARVAEPYVETVGTPTDAPEKMRREHWLISSFFFDEHPDVAWPLLKSNPNSLFLIDERAGRFGPQEGNIWPSLSAEKIYMIFDAFCEAWPKVFLPSGYGTGDPPGERAYRFLTDVVWRIGNDLPDRSMPVIDRMLCDPRFAGFEKALRSLRAETVRRLALQDFRPPSPKEVCQLFDKNGIASVEDLRALFVEELERMQIWLDGEETNPVDQFYSGGKRVDENTARNRIVDRLKARMTALNLAVVIEHQMADQNRCDITVSAILDGIARLLVIEVKGQWHSALFTAAAQQLDSRYAIHPNAERQGIYLALWFGPNEKVAGLKNTDISTPMELRTKILTEMPSELHGFIDVFVLDLSRLAAVS